LIFGYHLEIGDDKNHNALIFKKQRCDTYSFYSDEKRLLPHSQESDTIHILKYILAMKLKSEEKKAYQGLYNQCS